MRRLCFLPNRNGRFDKEIGPSGISENVYVIGTIVRDLMKKWTVFSNRPFRFEKGFAAFATLRFNLPEVSHEVHDPVENGTSKMKIGCRNWKFEIG